MSEHDVRYESIKDSDVHVGCENWARLAMDNSLQVASVQCIVTVT